ncbi:MAG: FtsH protease activity modulator HflK [Burkholderiaceae bacterium]|jgi:membrane protease subunit HflK
MHIIRSTTLLISPMIRRFRGLFSIGDPRWGKGQESSDSASKPDQPSSESNGSSNGPSNESGQDRPQQARPSGSGDRRDRQGEPPDLDEVWRDFNRKLGGLFTGKKKPNNPWANQNRGNNGGGNGGGGGGGPSMPNMPSIKVTGSLLGVGLAGLLVLWLASGFYIVQEGQTSLVLRFGEYKYASGAGFNWRMPYPIESHETVNIAQLRQATVGFRGERSGQSRDSLMLTKDENMIDMQFAVQYRVGRPEEYLFNNVRPDDIVTQAAETAMREVVGRSLSDAVLYENKEAIGREALQITQRIADRYGAGLTIVNITIQNVQPPEEVQAAFSDAIKAAQDAERVKNEGQAYANDVIPRARGAADRLLEEAEGYRERVVAQAQGDAERFSRVNAEYSKAPAVTRERMYLETMQQVFTNVSKVMVESRSNSNLLYLPLDKIMSQTSQQAQQAATAAADANANAAGQTGSSQPSSAGNTAANAARSSTDNRGLIPSLRDRFRESR